MEKELHGIEKNCQGDTYKVIKLGGNLWDSTLMQGKGRRGGELGGALKNLPRAIRGGGWVNENPASEKRSLGTTTKDWGSQIMWGSGPTHEKQEHYWGLGLKRRGVPRGGRYMKTLSVTSVPEKKLGFEYKYEGSTTNRHVVAVSRQTRLGARETGAGGKKNIREKGAMESRKLLGGEEKKTLCEFRHQVKLGKVKKNDRLNRKTRELGTKRDSKKNNQSGKTGDIGPLRKGVPLNNWS